MVNQLPKEGCRSVATATCEFQVTHTECVKVFSTKVLVRTLILHSLLETGPGFIMGRGHTSGPPEVG